MMRLAIMLPLLLAACTPGRPAVRLSDPVETPPQQPVAAVDTTSALFTDRDPLYTASLALVNWWPGNGHSLDLAGHRHATLERPVTYMKGPYGKAFTFNYGAYVDCGPADPPLPENAFTLSLWYFAEVQETWQYLAWSGDKHGLAVALNTELSRMIVTTSQGENATPDESRPRLSVAITPDASWHHLAVTFDGRSIRLYHDGALAGSAPCEACVPGNRRLLLASTARPENCFFKGRMLEIALFSRPLTGVEVRTIHEVQSRAVVATGEFSEELLAKFRDSLLGVSAVPAWYVAQRLPAAGEAAVPLLAQSVVPHVSTVEKLLADFDDESWRVRENAMIQLRAYGKSIRPVLLSMRDRGVSPEAEIRVIDLLYNMKSTAIGEDAEFHARIAQCLVRLDSARGRKLAQALPMPPKYLRPREPSSSYFEADDIEIVGGR